MREKRNEESLANYGTIKGVFSARDFDFPKLLGRCFGLPRHYVFLFCVLSAANAYSGDTTNAPTDPVAFFKLAISTPPDVEEYVASGRSIKSGTIAYYSGARAGSNFFLRALSSSNALGRLDQLGFIDGRSGTSVYGFGKNFVNYGIGSNAMMQYNGVLFQLTRQYLNLGLSEIKPESVKWTRDTFDATLDNGYPRYGKLTISNGLPFRLEIGVSNGSLPYKMVEYAYPNPPAALAGYPFRMVISGNSEGKLEPAEEVLFYSVRLAGRPLADNFFAANQFVGTNIVNTNVYSNSDLYATSRHGPARKVPNSMMRSGGYTNSHARLVIYLMFGLSVVVPIALYISHRKKQKQLKG